MTDYEKIQAVKSIMKAYRIKVRAVAFAEEKLREARDEADHPRITSCGNGGISSGDVSLGAAQPIFRLDTAERNLQREIDAILPETQRISDALAQLPASIGKEYVNLYYCAAMTREEITEGMYTSKGAFWNNVESCLLDLYPHLCEEETS